MRRLTRPEILMFLLLATPAAVLGVRIWWHDKRYPSGDDGTVFLVAILIAPFIACLGVRLTEWLEWRANGKVEKNDLM